LIKVIHIVPDLERGGGQQVAINILRGMDRTRFEPMVISLFGRHGAAIETQLEEEKIRTVYLDKNLGIDVRIFLRIHRTLKALQADVVHTHLNCLRYALPAIIALKSRVRAIHTIHNLAQREVGALDRPLYRFAFRHLGVVPVAIAGAVQDSCRHVYGLTAPIITNGIALWRYQATGARSSWRAQQNIADDEVVLACVGRLSPQKNHNLLLEALALAVRKATKIRCFIVGDGPLAQELQAKTEALSLQSVVQFLGHRSDIPEILSGADVGVLSSDWEGNPLCVMEMMASGTPVIATAVGGVPELIAGGAGILVRPGDVHGFADAICKLASDREARVRMGDVAARIAQQRFSTESMTRRYEELYVSKLSDKAPCTSLAALGD
jgi:glycosyltransferase involved in cell wall biosynthesis